MKIPNYEGAFVSEEKLNNYLLSFEHLIGRSKAFFFLSLGFNRSNVSTLKEELLRLIKDNNYQQKLTNEYGVKYVVDGKINTPQGRKVMVRTCWIVENDQTPRFVTAYPLKEKT